MNDNNIITEESFTNQKPRRATEHDLKADWSGGKDGIYFRCYLCGYKFQLGDVWRWVYGGIAGYGNFLVCEKCDGEDVLDRWIKWNMELKQKAWWLFKR